MVSAATSTSKVSVPSNPSSANGSLAHTAGPTIDQDNERSHFKPSTPIGESNSSPSTTTNEGNKPQGTSVGENKVSPSTTTNEGNKPQSATREQKIGQLFNFAQKIVGIIEPSLQKSFDEHDTIVGLVPSSLMPESENAQTGTALIYRNGQIIGGGVSIMKLNKDTMYDPNKSLEYNTAKMLAVYAHECYHLQQPQNPTKGNLGAILPDKTLEIDAYRKELAFLEKTAERYEKAGKIEMAKAIRQVMAEDKALLENWEKKK